jgi:hypothetical protein
MREFDGNSLTKRLQDAKRGNEERRLKATAKIDNPAAIERKAAERAAAQARRVETAAAAQSLGRRGGKARAEKMTAERRAEIARKGRKSGWSN